MRPVLSSIVLGAGQAGLSVGYHLERLGLRPTEDFLLLDANAAPGGAWQHRWSSLTMADVHGVAALPGSAPPTGPPTAPANAVVPGYFADYERRFGVTVLRPVDVTSVQVFGNDVLRVDSAERSWLTRTVINATGTWNRPFLPYYPGARSFQGRQLHTQNYRGSEEFCGQRVIVVGGGASAVQLLAELSEVASTTWEQSALRRGVYERQPMYARVTAAGAQWSDGRRQDADALIWATGFRPDVAHLASLRLRTPAGGIQLDGTAAVRDRRIQLVGYGPSASTIGANRAGRVAAANVLGQLEQQGPARLV